MTLEREPALGRAFFVGVGAAVLALVLFAWLAEEVLEGRTRAFDQYVRPGAERTRRTLVAGSDAVLHGIRSAGRSAHPRGAVVLFFVDKLHWERAAVLFAFR